MHKRASVNASVDTALREREAAGRPIRVGMVGAGATGRAIALQLGTPVPGIRLVAIANRTPEHGERAFREAGITEWSRAEFCSRGGSGNRPRVPVLTDDPSVLTACDAIDVTRGSDGHRRSRRAMWCSMRLTMASMWSW